MQTPQSYNPMLAYRAKSLAREIIWFDSQFPGLSFRQAATDALSVADSVSAPSVPVAAVAVGVGA